MNQETTLRSATGQSLALQSVQARGQLDGLMLSMTISQNYRNDTGKDLEIVYTFPLEWGTVLLGLEAEIGGRRLQATVVEKKEAEEEYEKALEEGDAPIMVQQSAPDLYTANLGNIKAGESVGLTLHCGRLLRFEQGRIRAKIPTVVAPRYGQAHGEGGLAPHETDAVDSLARYPFSIQLDVLGDLARAKISCPSHTVSFQAIENGISVRLAAEAWLDRDFILLLEGLAGHSLALAAQDGEQHVMLAGFCPQLPPRDEPLLLKILVDCSGSMEGDSIREAKEALKGVLRELQPRDYISYSRFGGDVRHESSQLQPCSPETLRRLAQAVAATEADMGGTEMERALLSVFKEVAAPEGLSARPDLLLITDGEVWAVESVVRAALDQGQRVFAVGVGGAPAESLLRELAEQTGGACEFVSPNEDMAAAVARMFRRLRGARAQNPRMAWGGQTLWRSPLPAALYDQETLHLFAVLAEAPKAPPELTWEAGGQSQSARPDRVGQTENPHLARLAAAERLETADPEEALALALKYQLISLQTSLFLTYVREEEDKASGLPELHQIPQMMAAGSHGYGTVDTIECAYMIECDEFDASFTSTSSYYPGGSCLELELAELLPEHLPDSLPAVSNTPTPREVLEFFSRAAVNDQDFAAVLKRALAFAGNAALEERLARLGAREGLPEEQVWAAFLEWLLELFAVDFTPARQARRLLWARLKPLGAARKSSVRQALRTEFSAVSPEAWPA
ncbi:MAG: VIT and VWA domain-containing protein [Candidatus Adiutrix sp.]|nr:VIT and VWA domain-containing protein [Candidatus Adiutrix sp.]